MFFDRVHDVIIYILLSMGVLIFLSPVGYVIYQVFEPEKNVFKTKTKKIDFDDIFETIMKCLFLLATVFIVFILGLLVYSILFKPEAFENIQCNTSHQETVPLIIPMPMYNK